METITHLWHCQVDPNIHNCLSKLVFYGVTIIQIMKQKPYRKKGSMQGMQQGLSILLQLLYNVLVEPHERKT